MANLDQYGQPLRDPASAVLQRKYALAQALQREGMSAAPLVGAGNNTMQALARVLQGGIGAYLGQRAEGEAQAMSDAQKAEREKALATAAALYSGTAPVAPAAAPMTDRLGGAPPVEPPAAAPQVEQQPLGPTPPAGMYGRNAGAAAQRDAVLDAPPAVLASASADTALQRSGLPAAPVYREPDAVRGEGGAWAAGLPRATGAVPAIGGGGGAPPPAAPQAAPASPNQDPDDMRRRAGILRGLSLPQGQSMAAALEQQAAQIEARRFRVEDRTDTQRVHQENLQATRALQAEAREEARRRADIDDRREAERLRLAQEQARNGRLPQGYEYGPDNKPRRIELPENASAPYAGNSIEAQDSNILLRGDPSTREYAAAFARQSAARVNVDGSTVTPNMSAYAPPTFSPGGAAPANFSQPTVTEATRPTADQSKVATFAERLTQALPIIERENGAGLRDRAASNIPVVGNMLTSATFQQADQAQRDYINAVLRRESGAAIGNDEFANARQQYFPQPGDSPEVLAQKKANRETVMQGFIREAGPAYRAPTPGGGAGAAPAAASSPGGRPPLSSFGR